MINDIVELTKSVHMHSLQHLAALRVAIFVCESKDVQHMLRGFRKAIVKNSSVVLLDTQWTNIRVCVKAKLNQIGMPDLIIDIVFENLWPICFEIFKWIVHHAEDTGIKCSSDFCWTPQCNIDYLKTAESLVRNEDLNIKSRFKLACLYCLDSEVRSLWDEMSLSEKRCFFMRGNLKISKQNPIILYWTYYIQEVQLDYWGSKILNYTHLFRYAVQNGYLSATKYFVDRLKIKVRDRMIMNAFTCHLHDIFKPQLKVREQLAIACFLFCLIPYDTTMPIYLILLYFLEWPVQKYFMTIVDRVRQYSSHFTYEGNFASILEAIIEKDAKDFKDHDYKALFIEFWHQFPEHKTYVNTKSDIGFQIFMKFVKKHFGFVFEETSYEIKAKFRTVVFQQEISKYETYFEKGNVDFFKFLVLKQVIIKPKRERFPYRQSYGLSRLPMEELIYLTDGILDTV